MSRRDPYSNPHLVGERMRERGLDRGRENSLRVGEGIHRAPFFRSFGEFISKGRLSSSSPPRDAHTCPCGLDAEERQAHLSARPMREVIAHDRSAEWGDFDKIHLRLWRDSSTSVPRVIEGAISIERTLFEGAAFGHLRPGLRAEESPSALALCGEGSRPTLILAHFKFK